MKGIWLDLAGAGRAPLPCILRTEFDSSAADHFSHPGSPACPPPSGSHRTRFPVEPGDILTLAKDVLSCHKSILTERREPTPIPNLALTCTRVPHTRIRRGATAPKAFVPKQTTQSSACSRVQKESKINEQ